MQILSSILLFIHVICHMYTSLHYDLFISINLTNCFLIFYIYYVIILILR